MAAHLLSILIFLPIVVALLSLFIPASNSHWFRIINLGVTVVQLLLLAIMLPSAQAFTSGDFIFTEKLTWFSIDVGSFGILRAEYFVGLDGMSFSLVVLSVLVLLIAAISSLTIHTNRKGYFVLLMILNGSIIGMFCALDFLLFYLFFEFMLLPMYFLIGIWGGARREYASIKFLLYTLAGSILILIVIIALYVSGKDPASGQLVHTFNILMLQNPDTMISGSILSPDNTTLLAGLSLRTWAFLLLFIGFAIKLPAVPLHTWLPDAHVEAPTPISVLLAALLLKAGGYGILRMAYPIFPAEAASLSWLVALTGVVSIIYGGFNALGSSDLKRLIAYSSVSHMGFVLLGIASATPEGVSGAVYQMFSHGIISALLFIIAGVLYDRTHDRHIENYSGLSSRMPVYFTVVLLAFFASLGLPGFSGFIAEVMVLLGAFHSPSENGFISGWYAVVATTGLLLGAGYYLWTIQRMFLGTFFTRNPGSEALLHDLDRRERSMTVSLILVALLLGIFPQLLLDYINPYSGAFVQHIHDYLRQVNP